MRRITFSLILTLLLSTLSTELMAAEGVSLKINLLVDDEKITVIEGKAPQVNVEIVNQGKESVTLVQPGDGSSCGWRTPLISWSVLSAENMKSHPEKVVIHAVPRCGNVNPITESEVVTLQPGEKMTLNGWIGQVHGREPGLYRVVFYYQNDPTIIRKGLPLGKDSERALKAIQESTPCLLKSQEVLLEILPAKEEQ